MLKKLNDISTKWKGIEFEFCLFLTFIGDIRSAHCGCKVFSESEFQTDHTGPEAFLKAKFLLFDKLAETRILFHNDQFRAKCPKAVSEHLMFVSASALAKRMPSWGMQQVDWNDFA
jgi:hypothetical protein